MPDDLDKTNLTLRRAVHQAIDQTTKDLEMISLNLYVSRIRTLTNDIVKAEGAGEEGESIHPAVMREALETLAILLNPVVPHLAEEIWHMLGHQSSLTTVGWPQADPAFLVHETITQAIQVNGKLRGTIEIVPALDQELIKEQALALENVKRAVGNKTVRKVIIVPGKVVNIVCT